MKKTTLATLVGAAAFAAAGAANATIVVGGENGYEFSVDGNINQFFVQTDSDVQGGSSEDNSRLRNGLLPAFFGFNVKAPEINGLTVGARVSISPSTNGGSYFNEGQNGNAMEQREAFATIDGSFGSVMLGKGLGLYASNNILLDQTLFGVGAVLPGNADNGQTTLGRIGYGYDYADWRSQIRWTSADLSGFKVAVAVMDADEVGIYSGGSTEKDPRFEGQLSYAAAFDGGSAKLWLDGMTQKIDGASGEVKSRAYTVGGQLLIAGFEFVGTYYDNEGVGDIGGLLFATGTDTNGDEREGDGYYVQAGYNFGGSTWLKASYGRSTLDQTSFEKVNGPSAAGNLGNGAVEERGLTTVGIYHDVTANLKLVAEYSRQEDEFHANAGLEDLDTDIFSLGGFISW